MRKLRPPTIFMALLGLGYSFSLAGGADKKSLITFTSLPGAPNGAWCWYQDERAIVDTEHPDGPLLLIATVSFAAPGDPEHGDIDALWYNVATRQKGAFELCDQLEADDHNVASFHSRLR
jgi:hypothetical protein